MLESNLLGRGSLVSQIFAKFSHLKLPLLNTLLYPIPGRHRLD